MSQPQRNVRLTSLARRDLLKSYNWYKKEAAGLEHRFMSAVVAAIDVAVERPTSFPVIYKDLRRVILKTFPYGLFFRIVDDAIRVVAILHLHRRPSAWRRRS